MANADGAGGVEGLLSRGVGLLWACLLGLLLLHLTLDLKGDSGIHTIRTLGHPKKQQAAGGAGAAAGSARGAMAVAAAARAAAATAAAAASSVSLAKGARAAAESTSAGSGGETSATPGGRATLELGPGVEQALQLLGAWVTDWDSYSHQLSSSASCRSGSSSRAGGSSGSTSRVEAARVGYYTRHTGTLWDWMAVAGALQLNWERRNPAWWHAKYGMSAATAAAIWAGNGTHTVCPPQYDVLVYCDTVVDARPVLQRLVAAGGGAAGGGCDKPIVLQVTNRFDWKVKDAAAYLALMRAAAASPRVWWVTNSPYEALYMSWQGLELPPERHLMLRPVGAAVLPPPAPAGGGSKSGSGSGTAVDRASTFAVVVKGNRAKHPDRDVLLPQLRKLGLLASHGSSSSGTARGTGRGAGPHLVHVYDRQYGGPAALAQHRGVVHLPYQMSIMGMYELLAAGGLYLLPSPAAFRQLRQKHRFATAFVPLLSRAAVRRPDGGRLNWTHAVEWYHPDFERAMVYWDSWEQLQQLMRLPPDHGLWAAKRAAARDAMAAVRSASLQGWRRVLGQAAEAACGP
ncbi:hypothetical protein HXX76_001750 [Chlamydomonas incerta]|uniref:Uncharacterized protein n=1 Tax=Chlamydomonas incerta TaxID=51695 RepID=A0A835TS12_CHLIN|nr:hypothetical protein HXX76_001750 [Chlamydomonas incerta]|eukprot:KAG2443390.1 hypothetical protein HXX76_001750 [Chlamydomonas incerta]